MSFSNFFNNLLLKYRSTDPNNKIVFDHYFFDLKYYLHQDSSGEEFSILLNISIEKLDQITHQNYGCSFHTLLNECRYRHLIDELESPINSNLTIESIIKLSGFNGNENFVDFIKLKQDSALLSNRFLANKHIKHPKSS